MNKLKKLGIWLPVLAVGALVGAGCGSDVGSAPVVNVSATQRAKDLDQKALKSVTWLEKMTPAERQAAVDKIPQVAGSLKEASDPALKQRIADLNIKLH